jgi:hypothetical protein
MDASMLMSDRIREECEPFVLYRLIDDQDSERDAVLCAERALELVSRSMSQGVEYDELSSMPMRLLLSQLHNSLAVALGDSSEAQRHYDLAVVYIYSLFLHLTFHCFVMCGCN